MHTEHASPCWYTARVVDVLKLSNTEFGRWLEETDVLNRQLFGRPLSAVHVQREKACFIQSIDYFGGGKHIGRANLTIFPLEVYDPALDRRAPIYGAVGGGGVLPGWDVKIQPYPFVLRAMMLFHRRRPLSRRNVYLLATNMNPLASFFFGRALPAVHPYPGRVMPGWERLCTELLERLYPKQAAEFAERGLISGPPPPRPMPVVRGHNPLLQAYVEMHGEHQAGERLPLVVRLNKSDVRVGVRNTLALELAKKVGRYEQGRVEPYRWTELGQMAWSNAIGRGRALGGPLTGSSPPGPRG